jgi:hypothetical protein
MGEDVMKKGNPIARAWIVILLSGTLLGCGHDPNHGIDPEQAKAAADRVHAPPDPNIKTGPGHGG